MGRLYEKGMGTIVNDTPIPKVLPATFALTEDWFTVFKANAGNLGRIEAGTLFLNSSQFAKFA